MSNTGELQPPETKSISRNRPKSVPVARQNSSPTVQRKAMSEQERDQGSRAAGERDLLLPQGKAETDFGEKTSGKRRHSRMSVRGGSFRASKKMRQELGLGERDGTGNGGSVSPQLRHKHQSSVSSISLLPIWFRLRNFGHHDLQSATLERLSSERCSSRRGHDSAATKKKPTGASAAHLHMDVESAGVDERENQLLSACPAFRNELGGHVDWAGMGNGEGDTDSPLLAIRASLSLDKQKRVGSRAKMLLEGTIPSKEIMEHKSPMSRHALQILQQQSNVQFPFEFIDYGALYYRNHFYQQDHQNFFGVDENLGPIAISLKREKINDDIASYFEIPPSSSSSGPHSVPPRHQYRVIIRMAELEPLRGTILEESIPSGTKAGTSRGLPPRDVVDYISQGEFQLSCLKLGKTEKVYQELMRLDEQSLSNKYKVGILYCTTGQTSEEDMYNNEHGSKAFDEFLQLIGRTVTMKGFQKYRAQLDNRTDTTGPYSVYAEYQDTEIMFHVSTYLPHTPSNRQQLLRKRHIGNDIVTVIFQEPGSEAFSPKVIRSHFQHIFVVVRVENPNTEYTKYRVAIARSQDIPYFGPPIPEGGVFDKNDQFKEFFLAKLINACNASLRSEKFLDMALRTRRQYLTDLADNCSSNLTIDQANNSGIVAGFLSKNWGGKKREKLQLQVPLVFTPGALVWNVAIILRKGRPLPFSGEHDTAIDCVLVVSADLIVLVHTNTKTTLLHLPTRDISGWIQSHHRINLFYDETYCISLEVYEQDDVKDIIARLQALAPRVSASHEAILMEFQRGCNGLLGFGINEVGVVQKVDGLAKNIGLQVESKLLQVEDKLVCCYKHTHITDVLTDRNRPTVRAYVIPPAPSSYRALMYYPAINWSAIWSSRPSHGEEDQVQNGTETMETSESRGGVVVRKRKPTSSSNPNRASYIEAIRSEESPVVVDEEEAIYDHLKETIYDRLRSTESHSSQSGTPYKPPRSPKPNQRRQDSNAGFHRVRGRHQATRDSVVQFAENLMDRRTVSRESSAGPSPEPVEHRIDIYSSHVPTHLSTSSPLPHSQPHTTVPLSSLRGKRIDSPLMEVSSPTSSSSKEPPQTPGSVHELAKKFSFNTSQGSALSSSHSTETGIRTGGGGGGGRGGGKGGGGGKATPIKATLNTSEMTRSSIPIPARAAATPVQKLKRIGDPTSDVTLRGRRSPKIRPASWDVSLIFNSEREAGREERVEEGEEGKEERGRQFRRKENSHTPVRKAQGTEASEGGREEGEGEKEGETDTKKGGRVPGEGPFSAIPVEQLSQEERRKISVRERTKHWEAKGGGLPSYFTLPKSFRTKGKEGGILSPSSPYAPTNKSNAAGSKIPTPSLTHSQKAPPSISSRGSHSVKQSTPPIQEETDSCNGGGGGGDRREKLREEGGGGERKLVRASTAQDIKVGSFVGERGTASSTRGRGGDGRCRTESEVTHKPPSLTNMTKRAITVRSSRSPSPSEIAPGGTPGGSKIPTRKSDLSRTQKPPSSKLHQSLSSTSPGHNIGQRTLGGRPPKLSAPPGGKSDTVALEYGLQSLHLSGGQPNANRKVEEWLQKQSTVATDMSSLPGKPDGPRDSTVVGSPSFTDNSLAMSDKSAEMVEHLMQKVGQLESQLKEETESKQHLQSQLRKMEQHLRDHHRGNSHSRSIVKTAMI